MFSVCFYSFKNAHHTNKSHIDRYYLGDDYPRISQPSVPLVDVWEGDKVERGVAGLGEWC